MYRGYLISRGRYLSPTSDRFIPRFRLGNHISNTRHVTSRWRVTLSCVNTCCEIQSLCQKFNCYNEMYILINNLRQVLLYG